MNGEMVGLRNEVFIGGNLNGHIRQSRDGFEEGMSVYDYGEKQRN